MGMQIERWAARAVTGSSECARGVAGVALNWSVASTAATCESSVVTYSYNYCWSACCLHGPSRLEKRAAHVGSVYSFFFAGYHRTTTRLQRGPPQRDPPSYAADLHSPLLQQPRHRSTDLDPPHRAPERGKSHTRTTGGREHDDGGAPPWNCNELHRRRGWRRRAGVWVSLFIFT